MAMSSSTLDLMSLSKQSYLRLAAVQHFSGTIQLPGSKSISNRSLLLAALAVGTSRLHTVLHCDDVIRMQQALQSLGVTIQHHADGCEITATGALSDSNTKVISVGNSGTCMRFLTAALSIFANDIILTGDERMQQRPIGDLVTALRQGGAHIDYLQQIGYPPLRIYGGFSGGTLVFEQAVSSQFISALLMTAPLVAKDTQIKLGAAPVSPPYIDMTIRMMQTWGIKIRQQGLTEFYLPGKQRYLPQKDYFIEGDASTASYFIAAAAIKGGPVTIEGLTQNSLQGDMAFIAVLKQMGAKIEWRGKQLYCRSHTLTGIDIDANAIPDAAMTLAIVALFATGSTRLRNIGTWRLKECDRLEAMAMELRKVGAGIEMGTDFIRIEPPTTWQPATIETYNDHRMAMCFSLLALAPIAAITILNPTCTAKTFPAYFDEFKRMAG